MGNVVIWEYSNIKHDWAGQSTVLAGGVLATDEVAVQTGVAVPVKQVTTGPAPVDATPMTHKTNFVIMQSDTNVYYRMRPKHALPGQTFPAHNLCRYIPAGGEVIEAVYPSMVLSLVE